MGRRAFTLVELMVVIAIIGVTTAVIVSEMGGTFEDALLRANARMLIDLCDTASNRAISTGQTQVLKLDPSSGKFVVRAKAENSTDPAQAIAAAGELDTRIALLVREPQLDENEEDDATPHAVDTIAFFADGTADAREFLLRDRTGVELVMRINPVTSRLKILEEPLAQ